MKTTTLGLAALLLAGGLSVPALAATFDAQYYLTLLQQKGIEATDVSQASSNVIRAEVKLADGSTATRYFSTATLAPVGAPAPANTRVLSKLDVGGTAAAVANQSLLYDGDGTN
ncbi:MAG: hypothetical protein JWQ89_3975 [Devosia sp.]|uniref:hypothetical protein n=1 Tax=Devosia sp. TaxID=1871048 RepID=UPI00261B72D1|nr:hypothetical protein [Devosia sp.]MDB5542248.1 hypothetical protein [Devosia sp.]